MDLVKTDQACVKINSSGIREDCDFEITIPYQGDNISRTITVDNTPENIHVIYNLPSNTNILLRAFRIVTTPSDPITDSIEVNTGDPQDPSTPNLPDYLILHGRDIFFFGIRHLHLSCLHHLLPLEHSL